MDPLALRLSQLVAKLFADEPVKQALAARIESQGITEGILTEIRQIIDRSIAEYQKETELEVDRLDKELAAIEANYQKQSAELRRQEDQRGLEEARKKIQGAP